MNAAAVVVFFLFALVLTAWNGVRLIRPHGAGIVRLPDRVKGWLAVGVVMLLIAGGMFSVLHPTSEQIQAALGPFAILLSGIVAKWVWDATLGSPPFVLDGVPLMGALVVTPIITLAIWNQLTDARTLQTVLLCFSHGFFWQTIFSDVSKKMAHGPAPRPKPPQGQSTPSGRP